MSLHAALAILGPIAAYISSILSSARVLGCADSSRTPAHRPAV
jgi:hypothetical protein